MTRTQLVFRTAAAWAGLVLAAGAPALAQTTTPLAADSGVATYDMENLSGSATLNGTYFDIRHQANSGVGYRNGFTQFGAFTPIWGSPDWFIAPNARVNLTNDSAVGFNGGFVARYYHDDLDRIFGANIYYDYDKTTNNYSYDQIGFGVETLGEIVDARANGYVPSNENGNFVRVTGLTDQLVFFGNRLGFLGTQLSEQAMPGGDGEVGIPLAPNAPWLRGYVGGYGYRRNNGDMIGGFRARIEGWVNSNLSLGTMVTTDNFFGTNVNFIADWRFPGFQPKSKFPQFSTRDRMLMPVQRHWRITVGEYEEIGKFAANNPRDGEKYFVVWVDPNGPLAGHGSGTYEDPYRRLPLNVPQETDLVMVLRGDSSALNPSIGKINLPDWARMLGQGRDHLVDAQLTIGAFHASVDDASMPDLRFRNTGLYPFLTNPVGNIVNVASHNEVAAFVMTDAGGAAISGAHPDGFNLHHLEVRNNVGGIILTDAQGSGAVTPDGQQIFGGRIADINTNNVIGWVNPLGLGNNGLPGGIQVLTSSTSSNLLDLTLERISMNATTNDQTFGIRLLADVGDLNVSMRNIQTSGGNAIAGTSIEQFTGDVNATIGGFLPVAPGLDANFNENVGLRLISGSDAEFNLLANNINAVFNQRDNLAIRGDGNATVNINIHNSLFSDSVTGTGVSLRMADGVKTLQLTNVGASRNADFGVDLRGTGGTLNFDAQNLNANSNNNTNLNIEMTDGRFNGLLRDSLLGGNSTFNNSTTGSGIILTADNSGALLFMNNISASGNFGDGLQINATNGSQVGNPATAILDGVRVVDSTLIGNGGIGINQNVTGGSHLDLFVDPTNLSNNGVHASRFSVLGGSTLTAFYDQTNFSNSITGSGILGIVSGPGSAANVLVQNSLIRSSGADGVFLSTSNGALANLQLTDVVVQNNGQLVPLSSGIQLLATGLLNPSTINLTLDGTTVSNNLTPLGPQEYGLTVNASGPGTSVNVSATGTNFDNNNIHGIRADYSLGSNGTFLLTNVSSSNSGADGMNVVVDTGSIFNACLDSSIFNDNTAGGIRLRTQGTGSISTIGIEDAAASNNGLGGLVANVFNGGQMNLRTIASSFNGNGGDGVFSHAEGDDSVARLLFNTTSADNNGGNGFNFESYNGAYMTARIDSISAQNNALFGVRLDVQGVLGDGTFGILLPSGTNTVAGNGSGSYDFNFSGVSFAPVILSGSFNNQPADGVNVAISNVETALVSVTGDGTDTIDNNTFDGIDIDITDAQSAGVRIGGYASISGNGDNGIEIDLTNITDAASVQINGPTNMIDNASSGIALTMTNVQLGNFVIPPGFETLSVVTLTDSSSLNDCFPVPVDVDFNLVAFAPTANGVLIEGMNIDRNPLGVAGQDGIRITGDQVTGAGSITLDRNTTTDFFNGVNANFVNGSNFGGINVTSSVSNNSAQFGFNITQDAGGTPITIFDSAASNSGNNGVNLSLTNTIGSPDITLTNVSAFTSGANGVALLGSGDIGNVTFTGVNASNSAGGDGIRIDLTNANVTGDILLTGSTVDQSTGNGINLLLDGVTGGPNVTTQNSTISNSGGLGINLSSVGATLGAVVLDPLVVSNSGADGVRVDLTNAQLTSLLIDALTITNSGANGLNVILDGATGNFDTTLSNISATDSAGRGVQVAGAGSAANPMDLGDVTLTNVTATNSTAGEGVRIAFSGDAAANADVGNIRLTNVSSNTSSLDGINIALNTIAVGPLVSMNGGTSQDSATGDGIEVNFNNVVGAPDVNISRYTVDDNAQRGIAFLPNGSQVGDVTITSNVVSDSAGGQGILADLTNTVVDSLLIDDSAVSNSGGTGVDLVLSGVTGNPDITVSNTRVTNSAGRGVQLFGAGTAANPLDVGNVTLTNVTATNSTAGEGVRIAFTGDAAANADVGNIQLANVSSNTSSLDGINIALNTIAVGPLVSMNGGTSQDSATGDGIEVNFNNVVGAPDVNISRYTVDDNAQRGIAFLPNGSQVGDVTITSNVVSDSAGGQGILADLTNSIVGSLLIDDSAVSNSAGRGVDVVLFGTTGSPDITVSNTNVTNSGGNGVRVESFLATLGDISLTNVTSDGTGGGASGVFVNSTLDTLGSITLTNVSANDSGNNGIFVQLTNTTMTGVNPAITLDGQGTAFATNNSSDGIRVDILGVIGTPDISIDNYANVSNNGNRGIFLVTNGDSVGDVNISGNTVSDSLGGQGIFANLTNSTVASVVMDDNTVSDSASHGIDLLLNGVDGNPDITLSNSTVTNSAGVGVQVTGAGTAANPMNLGDITLTNVTANNSTAGQGVRIAFTGDAAANADVGNIRLSNVSSNTSSLDGINITLNTIAVGPLVSMNGGTSQDSATGDGIEVNFNNVVGAPDVNISRYTVDDNAQRGIALLTNGSQVDDVTITSNVVSDSAGGQGILADLTNSIVGSVLVDDSAVSNSGGNGVDLVLSGVTGNPDITVSNTRVTNSTGRGVQLLGTGTAANPMDLGDVTLSNLTIANSTAGQGVRVQFTGDAAANANVGAIQLSDISATDSSQDGILVSLNTVTVGSPVSLQDGTVANSGGDGIEVNFTGVVGTPDVNISGFTVSNSGGRGIAFLPGGSPVDDVTISDNTVSDSLGGQGIVADFTNGVLGSLTMDGDTVSNSFGRGIDVILSGTTGLPNIAISDATVTNSGGRGISVSGTGSAANQMFLGTIDLTNVSSDTTLSEDGIAVVLSSDVPANGKVGSVTITNPNSVNSFGFGVVTSLTNMTIDPSITIDGQGTGEVTNNGGGGILVSLNNVVGVPTNVDVIIEHMAAVDENNGNGVSVVANGTDIRNLTIEDNAVRGNDGHGVNIDLTSSDVTNFNVLNNRRGSSIALGFNVVGSTFGLPFRIDNNSVSNIDIVGFTFDISTNTSFPGANFDTDSPPVVTPSAFLAFTPQAGTEITTGLLTVNGTTAPDWQIPDESQVMTATFGDFNPGENFQWLVDLDQTPGGDEGFSGDQLIGSTVTVTFANGEILSGTMTAVPGDSTASQFVSTSDLLGAGISTNHGDGIHIVQNNSNIANILIDDNEIAKNDGLTGSGLPGHGINFATVNNSNIGPTTISNNDINGNSGDGVHLIDPNTANNLLDLTFTGNAMDLNGANGVNLQISQGEILTLNMTGNDIGSEADGNGGMGVRIDLSGTSSLVATIGDSAAAANNFISNVDAGVGITLAGTATASIAVENSNFAGSTNGADANFAGVGLGISLVDSTTLNSLTVGDAALNNTSFSGNASHGFLLQTNGSATATSNTIRHVVASENTGDGLNFTRIGDSRIDNTTMNLVTATGNTGNGLNITAADRDDAANPDTYAITNSTFSENTGNGVRMNLVADGDLQVSISGSTVSNNLSTGIQTSVNSDITDTPTINLAVTTSTIDGNTGHGIQINAPHVANISLNTITNNTVDGISLTGSSLVATTDTIFGNTISKNGDDGIEITSTFIDANIAFNTISENGDDGIAMDSSGGNEQQLITIDQNDILANEGDGIQIAARQGSGTPGNPNTYTITDNLIADNARRGINVVNAGGTNGDGGTALQRTVTNLTISGNDILRSGLEAIYVVNTASETQANAANINNLASTAMLTDGSVFAKPILNLNIDDNIINSNGQTQNVGNFIGSTGIVLRVGTSDASTSFTDNGGFAAGGSRGGVVASVTNNNFAGQFGSDVTFQPFISTAPPATTVGTWTDQNTEPRVPGDDVFTITSFVSDPLARLDLTFTGNSGDGLFATNTGASSAFYNNDEPEFKSRGITGVSTDTNADGAPGFPASPDDNGPFTTGTRARNATRQASRAGLPPTIAAGSTFPFAGMGASTFRLNSAIGAPNSFTTIFSDFSTVVPIGGAFGEEPFLWGSF